MVTYIYFVKRPNCEDEPFDFFDEAKGYAMGCLSQKPVITQTEVCRNDFGECTDSADLGQVWSWEDIVGTPDEEPAIVFSKDDIVTDYNPDNDPEFQDDDFFAINTEDFEESCRKPIPEGMTIEELVEEMEENEDTVECTWCEELFGKDQCRYEVDLGWLCGRCEAAIKSRGETLTFKENNYWDFLDEGYSDSSDKFVIIDNPEDGGKWFTMFDINNGHAINYICAKDEDSAAEQIQYLVPGNIEDIAVEEAVEDDLEEIEEFLRSNLKEDIKEVHDLGNEYDGGYPTETPKVSDSHLKLCPECGKETFDNETGICVTCGFN